MNLDRRRQVIDPAHPALSIVRQCELVSISRLREFPPPACGRDAGEPGR